MSTIPAVAMPRSRRSATSLIVAATLLGGGGTAFVDIIRVAVLDLPSLVWPQSALTERLARTPWDSPSVTILGTVLAVLGLLLLGSAVMPGRRGLLRLQDPGPASIAYTNSRSVRRSLTAAATDVDGVTSAKVRLRGRTVKVRAHSPLRDLTGLQAQVQERVCARLAAVGLVREPRVRVRVTRKESS